MFPAISATTVDAEQLRLTESESDFVGVGVDLLIEAASYQTIAFSVYRDERGWTIDEAIIGGNGVRLHKLIQGYLDQTCQHRRELSEIFSRLIFETATNIVFLIRFGDESVSRSYIDYSLKYERRLRDKILHNIDNRAGVRLPIEDRMLVSIGRLAEASGVDLSAPPLNKRNWADLDLFQKADAIGWGEAYLGIFGGMSGAVHGNWGDIAAHHLERFDGSGFYKPCSDWSSPRPQSLLSLARIVVTVSHEMFAYFGKEPLQEHFAGMLDGIIDRIEVTTTLHEGFLARIADHTA